MKSVLLSIRPKWCEKIASGKKTIEVRKSAPKEVPFKAYIYETYDKKYDDIGICWGNGKCFEHGCKKVIGEFICDKVFLLHPYTYDGGSADLGHRKFIQTFEGSSKDNEILSATCLSQDEMFDYIGVDNYGYGWHISNLKIYDKPRELSEFRKACEAGCWCYNCKDFDYDATYDGEDNAFCNKKPITRPPQSWQYVEEVEE